MLRTREKRAFASERDVEVLVLRRPPLELGMENAVKDKSEGKKDLCNKCYLKECRSTKQAMESGKSCCVCSTQITTEWKESAYAKDANGKQDICDQCFRRDPAHAGAARPRWKVKLLI